MEIPNYPPNSESSKRESPEDKNIKRVTSSDPKRRKRSLGKQFRETFVAGDPRSATSYVIFDVLLPAARDMIWETGSEYLRSIMFGETRRRGVTPPQTGPSGYFTYNRPPGHILSSSQRTMSRRARSRHDFDEIVIAERIEAEKVIDDLFEVVSKYGVASVADLYGMVGIDSTHTDNKWGWTDLRGAGVTRVRNGYLLDIPEPQPLD